MADGSLSQFKATLARKIERNKKRQARSDRNSSYSSPDSKSEYNFPKLSETELEKVKSDIRKKIKSDRKKELITIIIILTILTLVILFLN